MSSVEFPRTELLPTVIFSGEPLLDPNPIETPSGRFVPGPDFAKREMVLLQAICAANPGGSSLPTPQQLNRVTINELTGCWELPVYQDKKPRARYGQLSISGIASSGSLAHRSMYLVFYGADSLPNGRDDYLDHLCENKACCYPRHLERVSPAINTLRARSRYVIGQLTLSL